MASQKYEPLLSTDALSDDFTNYRNEFLHTGRALSAQRAWRLVYLLLAMLGVSSAANVILATKLHIGTAVSREGAPSIAGLEWDTPTTMFEETRSLEDPIWDAPETQWKSGYLALNHTFAQSHGATKAQNWPWDHNKGIYIVKAFHSMHCVYLLRLSIQQYRNGEEQLWGEGHINHCLGTLRDDVKCQADDTIQYTGGKIVEGNKTHYLAPGVGDTRVCRDWSKLYKYARANSACYFHPETYYIPMLDRYKFCPDGSKPWLGKEGKDLQG